MDGNLKGAEVDAALYKAPAANNRPANALSPEDNFRQYTFLSALQLLNLTTLAFLAPKHGLTVSPPLLGTAFALSLLPQAVALIDAWRQKVHPPVVAVGATSVLSIVAAYVVAVSGLYPGTRTGLVSTVFVLTLSPYLAAVGLWMFRGGGTLDGILVRAIGFLTVAHLTVLALLAMSSATALSWSVPAFVLAGLYLLCLVPPVTANWVKTRADDNNREGGSPKHDHISGVGALSLIIFVSSIVMLGVWATAAGVGAEISKSAGVIVIVGLALAFGLVAMAPYIPRNQRVEVLHQGFRRAVQPVGVFLSYFDSVLVFPIAGAVGANQTNLWVRYALLLGNLAPCAFLTWYLPAPYGLPPAAWAVIATIAVARRWAWIEEDRENAMLNRKFEGNHIKVGFQQDLRDETLLGFLALFLVVPIALRQLHLMMEGGLFRIDGGADVNDLWTWLGFFGTELAKAVPFVDWAEVYQVEGAAAVHVATDHIGMGQHVIFATRVLVDLVFLAALLQAISISQRTAKLKEMFYKDRTLDRLDPFLELKELRKLVVWEDGDWKRAPRLFEDFPQYDPDRLEELRTKHDGRAIGYVAEYLLLRDEGRPPEVMLADEAKRPEPDEGRCLRLLDQIERSEKPDIALLKSTHFKLVGRPNMRGVRAAITNIIAGDTSNSKTIDALAEILMGPGQGVADPRAEVRLIALNGLYHSAVEGHAVARSAINFAAQRDPAKSIREAAGRFLEVHQEWEYRE